MFEQQQKLFFHEIWTEIVNNQERTNQITADIETELKQNRYPLIISERKDHISHLSRSLKSKKLKIDSKITNRIWKNMILSYIDYEKRNFKKK